MRRSSPSRSAHSTAVPIVAVFLTGAGCFFDATIEATRPAPVIRCDDNAECPPLWTCDDGFCSTGEDLRPPQRVDVTIVPAVARGGSRVEIIVTADEDLGAPPALVFDGPDPGGETVAETPARWTRSFVLPPEGPDESFLLEKVEVVDAAGNRASIAVGERLDVDRTPAALSELRADRARYSRVPPFSEVQVTVDVGEPLDSAPASLAVLIGEAPLACGTFAEGSPSYTCVGSIDAAVPAGEQVVQAVSVDRAGNITVIGLPIVVDDAAPVVLPGNAAVSISGSSAASLPTLAPGTTATVVLEADEIVTFASARAVGPASFDFTTAIDGARVTATWLVVEAIPAGVYSFELDVTDDVGNVTGPIVIALPAPGLVAQADVPSPCVARFGGAQSVCTDFDGDGFGGASPGCDQGPDCNDDDPHVHPGGFDIAGDFTDNACQGGQGAPADESVGVFVAPDGDDAAPGTREAPKRTLAAAVAALGPKTALFLQEGTYADAGGHFVDHDLSVVGGFDASWRRGGASRIEVACDPAIETAVLETSGTLAVVDTIIHAVECAYVSLSPRVLVQRATIEGDCPTVDGCYVETFDGSIRAHASRFRNVTLRGADLSVLGSALEETALRGTRAEVVRSTIFGDADFVVEEATLVSSAVEAFFVVDTSLSVFHSTLHVGAIVNAPQANIRIENSIVIAAFYLLSEVPDAPRVVLKGSDIVAPEIYQGGETDPTDCSFPGCSVSLFVDTVDPELAADRTHLLPTSPLLGEGIGNMIDFGAPTTIAGDIDGECRDTGGGPDVGADEA